MHKNLKEHHVYKKYIWNLATCSCKNGKYLVSIIKDSVINEKKKNFFLIKKVTWETKKLFILLTFLLITIALLEAVSICCYKIKY